MSQWLMHWFGLDNLSGPIYGFWSGFGSDLGELTLVGVVTAGILAYWHHHNCHIKKCWHFQWKTVPGTDHVVCRKHHPHEAPTHAQVLEDHKKAQAQA